MGTVTVSLMIYVHVSPKDPSSMQLLSHSLLSLPSPFPAFYISPLPLPNTVCPDTHAFSFFLKCLHTATQLILCKDSQTFTVKPHRLLDFCIEKPNFLYSSFSISCLLEAAKVSSYLTSFFVCFFVSRTKDITLEFHSDSVSKFLY